MVGYVYFSGSLIINGKIDIVDYIEIDDNIKKIVGKSKSGNSEQITFDGGSNYIILEDDTINKNVSDAINLTGLVDARDYFIIGKEYYYMEKAKALETANNTLNEENNKLKDRVLATENAILILMG